MLTVGCLSAGKGVSSSAAVEVATMTALLAALNVEVSSRIRWKDALSVSSPASCCSLTASAASEALPGA